MNLKKVSMFFAALIMVLVGASFGAVTVVDQPYCKDLMAGQYMDAGDVCLEVYGDYLVVTYTTTGGWELMEAHLWVGADLADMPQTKKGNPKIGNFPYNSGDITGMTSYSFYIPLSSLGEEADLCGATFYAAAHAAVRKADGSGGYQTETGWAEGPPIVDKGSWAMYFPFQFDDCGGGGTPGDGCETAYAFGDMTFTEFLNTPRWGWQITVDSFGTFTTPIWAGAGQNDTSKGTYVGDLTYSYDGFTVTVSFDMFSPYYMEETHLYVGTVYVNTTAPGQYGHQHDLGGATSDFYTVSEYNGVPFNGETVYIVAHAVVCGF